MRFVISKGLMMRLIRTALASLIFAHQGVLAHALEKNFWSDRRLAMAPTYSQQSLPVPSALASQKIAKSELSDLENALRLLARDSGSVQKTVALPSARKKVIHILDVHGNLDAQKSIQHSIELLVKKGGVKLVALEGVHGNLPFQNFNQLDSLSRIETANAFLNHLDIGGPVHFALTQSDPGVSFVGVDDSVLFKKNWSVVRKVTSTAKALGEILMQRSDAFEKQKDVALNMELRSFDRAVQAYRNGHMLVGDYVGVLREHAPLSSPNLSAFWRAQEIEPKLSEEKIEKDRTSFLMHLMGRLPAAEQSQLVQLSKSVGAGTGSERMMLVQLADDAKRFSVSFPQSLIDYSTYLDVSSKIDSNQLLSEIKKMEAHVYSLLIQTPKEKNLIEASEQRLLAQRLVDFSLTPQEWQVYRNSSKAGQELAGFKSSFEAFFTLAHERDISMAENLCAAMKTSGADQAILVTGGFHAPGIQAALAENNIDVITVTPRFNVVESISNASSLLSVASKKTFFDEMFPEGNVFLPQPTWTNGLQLSFVLAWMRTAQAKGVKEISRTANLVLAPFSKKVSLMWTLFGKTFVLVRGKTSFQLAAMGSSLKEFVMPRVISIGSPLSWLRWPVIAASFMFIAHSVGAEPFASHVVPVLAQVGGVPATGGDGFGNILVTLLSGQSFTFLSAALSMLGTILGGFWLAFIYEKAHPRNNHDPDVPDALRKIPFLIAVAFIVMQQNLLLGIGGMLGPVNMFRQRAISRDQDDHTSLISAVVLGLSMSLARSPVSWGITLLFLALYTGIRMANYFNFMYGDKETPDATLVVEEISHGTSTQDWQELFDHIDRYAKQRSDFHRISSNPQTVSFAVWLKNPTNTGVTAGFSGFQASLMILFKDKFKFTFNDMTRGKSSGVTYGGGTQFGPKIMSLLLLLGSLFLAGTSDAHAEGIGSVFYAAVFADNVAGWLSGIGLLIGVYSLILFYRHTGPLPKKDAELQQRLNKALSGENELSPEDLALLRQGPQASSPARGLVHWLLRHLMPISFISGLVLFGVLFTMQNSSREVAGTLMMGEVRSDRQEFTAPVAGTLTMLVNSYQGVTKNQVIGTIDPLDLKSLELETQALRERSKSQILQAEVERLRAISDVGQAESNISGLRVRIAQLRLSLGTLERDMAVNEVSIRYLTGYDQRAKQLGETVPIEELEKREQAVKEIEASLRVGKEQQEKVLKEIQHLEKTLAAQSSTVQDASIGNRLKAFEALVQQINAALGADVTSLENKFRRRSLIAPDDGQIVTAWPKGGLVQVPLSAPIATFTSSKFPAEVFAFAPEAYRLPKIGDTVRVQNAAGENVNGVVTWVGLGSETTPNDVPMQQSLANLPPANRRGVSRADIVRGAPFTVQIPPNTFRPGAGVSVILTSVQSPPAGEGAVPAALKNDQTNGVVRTPTAENLSAPRDVPNYVGNINGRKVSIASSNLEFKTTLNGLSGAAVDGSKNRLYLSDNAAERIDVIDTVTGRLVTSIYLTFLRQSDEKKLDIEAIAVDPQTGYLVIALESQQRVHVINPSDPTNSVKTFTMNLANVNGLAIHPDGRIFVANSPVTNPSSIHEVVLDQAKGHVKVVRTYDLADSQLKSLRDLTFYPVTGQDQKQQYDLLLLSAGTSNSVHQLVIDGPQRGTLRKNKITIPSPLHKPEGMTVLPDGKLFVGSATNHVGGKNQVVFDVEATQGNIRPEQGTNAPKLYSFSFLFFLLYAPSTLWIFTVGLLLYGIFKLVKMVQVSSLRWSVASAIRDQKIILVTIMDGSLDKDLAKLSAIEKILDSDSTFTNYKSNVLVVYLGDKNRLPDDVRQKVEHFLAFKGPEATQGRFHVDSIFDLAQVALFDQQNKQLQSLVAELANPSSDKGSFALVSSQPQRLFVPVSLMARTWDLNQLLGFWSISPLLNMEDRMMQSIRSLIFA